MSQDESSDDAVPMPAPREKKDDCDNDNEDPCSPHVEMILDCYKEFCNRWDVIKLGRETGSKALNSYLEFIGVMDPYEKRYTPKDLIQIFETLLPRQELPPPADDILIFLNKLSDADEYEYAGDDEESLQGAVAKAYAVISTQHDEISNKKRKMHNLNAKSVIDKLASYDDKIAKLKEKEHDILKTSKDLGLFRRDYYEKGGNASRV
jgi:hypothetical protein